MKLTKLVSVFLMEDKHKQKQGQNFIVDVHVSCYRASAVQHIPKFKFVYFSLCSTWTGNWTCYHVEKNIWQMRQHFLKARINVLFCYGISKTKHELPDKIMSKIVQNCKGITGAYHWPVRMNWLGWLLNNGKGFSKITKPTERDIGAYHLHFNSSLIIVFG